MGSFPMSPPPAEATVPANPATPNGITLDTPRKNPDLDVRSVVLGDVHFKTWYPSFYPDELVGKRLDRLYVCKWCFKYCNDVGPYLVHLNLCALRDQPPPGELIYKHASHAIYEVDGAEQQLFAQNLSLFAKCFLDNKSVFFDVGSFNYYLLVARTTPTTTVPSSPSFAPAKQEHVKNDDDNNNDNGSNNQEDWSTHQIIGFFSKEKLSWDNNNLACILVFPPWQRKGLGRILMGVSYELSRREGRYGGPEKPLSELGKRGYKQFWIARVAREILIASHTDPLPPAPSSSSACSGPAGAGGRGGNRSRGQGRGGRARGRGGTSGSGSTRGSGSSTGIRKKTSLTVADLARRCWVLPEDCVAALLAIGVGPSLIPPPPPPAATTTTSTITAESISTNTSSNPAPPPLALAAPAAPAAATIVGPVGPVTGPSAARKRKDGKTPLDKVAVRAWVRARRLDLRAPVDVAGFCIGDADGTGSDEEEDDLGSSADE